ncbi:28840_t:CDS:1, partial [Gigaspora margarita]
KRNRKKNGLQTALKSFARNRNIKKVGHEGVRDYYDYKSAKRPDGNNNIGYIFRSLDKTTKQEKTL